MDKTWKAIERKVAKLMKGVRVPVTGRGRGDVPDIDHPFWSIEVKHRQSLPSWILEAMEQARASNKGEKYSVSILHQKGMSVEESLAVMELRDLLEIKYRLEQAEKQLNNPEVLKGGV